jgi:hypothetical protein
MLSVPNAVHCLSGLVPGITEHKSGGKIAALDRLFHNYFTQNINYIILFAVFLPKMGNNI